MAEFRSGIDFVTKIKKSERFMSLLPIIYSSILIFSGILVFVVIISYVSFKIKGDDRYYMEDETSKKRDISKTPFRQTMKDINKMPDAYENEDVLREKNLHGKIVKPVSPQTKSEYRKKTKKLNEKNVQILYKEKDLFNRSRPRVNEPRFSVIKDISEHLVKIDSNEKSEGALYKTSHMIEVGSVDYLRFYENY
jgi:hypothetical protein